MSLAATFTGPDLQTGLNDQSLTEALEGIVLPVVLDQEHLPKSACSQCGHLLQVHQLDLLHNTNNSLHHTNIIALIALCLGMRLLNGSCLDRATTMPAYDVLCQV